MKYFAFGMAMIVLGFVFGVQWCKDTTPRIHPSATLVQFTDDHDVILGEFLLEQRLREPFMLPPALPPMPMPRFLPPIYLYQQSPCP